MRRFVLTLGGWLATAGLALAETAHGDGHHGAPGLAEDLPFWGIVAFIGFLVALKYLGWDALTGSMREREQREAELIVRAEQLREEARQRLTTAKGSMEALDEEIREVLAEANRDADHTRSEFRRLAEREAGLARTRAEVDIARVKDQSLNEIFETLSHRVTEAAEQRIRERMTSETQQRLIDAAVQEFQRHQPQAV